MAGKGRQPGHVVAVFAHAGGSRALPARDHPPHVPLPKPEPGRDHLGRFIRSDRRLAIFGERFIEAMFVAFEAIVLRDDTEGELRVIAELVEVPLPT